MDLRLGLDSCEPFRIVGEVIGQGLQRDIALQLRVVAGIHVTHSGATDAKRVTSYGPSRLPGASGMALLRGRWEMPDYSCLTALHLRVVRSARK